jgi:phage terminase large subunit GpA-like protein
MRQYHVPCPHCGELQVLRWRHDDGRYGLIHNAATGAVYYACIHCGERIDEHHKPAMLAAGRWIPRHPERAVRGYHLSGLYSPIGLGFTWAELWRKWEEAHGDTANLKRFINTTLGESWEEQGDSIEDLALIARLEDYPETLPASLRTAGVDVQKDRLEATIVAWGAGEEGWLIDHLILPGDTARPEVWEALHDALTDAGIAFAAIDSGYNTSMVYAFTERRRWSVAVKGITGMGRPLIEDEKKRRQRLRNRRKKAAHVEPLGVDQGKALLYARLKLPVPGPAYLHFPRDPAFDDEYFAQLAAEKLVTKIRGTRPFQEWVQTRPRNEALDCLLYALAALRLSGKTPAAPVASSPQPTPTPSPRRPMLPRGINHTPRR